MGDDTQHTAGEILWTDLTVNDAASVRDFYRAVVGWQASDLEMDGYCDYSMSPPSGNKPSAGICHARGPNADLPALWLIYITVDDLDRSMARCRELGGEVVAGPKEMGDYRYCVIRDPAGAVAALFARTT